ncbi:MAG: FkbM family methyltransferase [Flavobacteriaceae bacterium]
MKRILRFKVENQLAKRGFIIQRITPKEKLIKLIKILHPLKTQSDLIRIGPNGDGGYLVPNDLNDIEACFSPGVDNVSEFELWCLNNGMEIYLADRSVDKVNLNIPKDQYNFIKKFVGCTNNEDFITLDEWVNSTITKKNSELLLQMDIEGGEYDSLINISDSLMKRFRILVIEFHSLHKLWNPEFFHFAEIAFSKILQTHSCVHIHPNNYEGVDSKNGIQIPKVAEFTFLRKDRISSSNYETSFPHELDFDNNSSNEHIILPKNWYKSS